MLTKTDVVYKMDVKDRKPVLRFMVVATRKFATHDEASTLTDIPDIFAPTSLPGMKQATWQASCLPMKAMGAMVDAEYAAFEDIDRLDALAAAKAEEAKSEAFNKMMTEFTERAAKALEEAGAFKGPYPYHIANAIIAINEYERRKNLAAEKMKNAAEAGMIDSAATGTGVGCS